MLEKIWAPFWWIVILASIAALPFSFNVSLTILVGSVLLLFFVLLPIAVIYRMFRFLRFRR